MQKSNDKKACEIGTGPFAMHNTIDWETNFWKLWQNKNT